MIKVEIVNTVDKRLHKDTEIYNYVQQWNREHSHHVFHKILPERNHIVIYDQESFKIFQETYKKKWRRVW